MIEHEMLFLGLLLDSPKHGYEIKRKIVEELFPLLGVKIKSIYYPLQTLEQGGLVAKDLGREGNFPEKVVYRITPKGRKRFDELINESFSTIDRPYFTLDLSLYFLQYIDRPIARRKLKARLIFLKRIRRSLQGLKGKAEPAKKYLHIILDHDLDLVEAEIKSNTRLLDSLTE